MKYFLYKKPCSGVLLCILCGLLFISLLPLNVVAEDSDAYSLLATSSSAYQEELRSKAQAKRLWQDATWRALVHYKSDALFIGDKSMVDGPEFFLSPEGKTNPKSELLSTLDAFFLKEKQGEEHPLCRFPARRRWLVRELEIIEDRFPSHNCEEYDIWLSELKPEALTLVFPSAYLNNPASMFGHTFLRIDGADVQSGEFGLLGYAASFGAATAEMSGIIFAIRAFVGGYRGVFTVEPYYKRVKTYSDLENRDIWEYQLSLNEDEVLFVVEHLWELLHTYFDYYFLDENCSYHLLSLLDVVTPEQPLTDEFGAWVIPIDTLRVLSERDGLVVSNTYRPSNATSLGHLLAQLSTEEAQVVKDLSSGRTNTSDERYQRLPTERKALVAKSVAEYLNYKRLLGKASEEEMARSYGFLVERSKLGIGETSLPELSVPARPEEGHRTARVSLGAGYDGKRAFAELAFRPAYHELLDLQTGYVPGAQIEFLAFTFRHYEEDELDLESFYPLSIVSLSPQNRFFSPISWSLKTGVERKRSDRELGVLSYGIEGGPGVSYNLGSNSLLYALSRLSLELGPDYEEEKWSVGIGGVAGVFYDLGTKYRIFVSTEALRYGLGELYTEFETEAGARLALATDVSIQASVSRNLEFSSWRTESVLSLQYFF